MFGRVRAAPSMLDCAELERPPSKLIKGDSLSIYEATILKLKLGSQRHLGSSPGIAMETENDCISSSLGPEENCTALNALNTSQLVSHHNGMIIDTDCPSASISPTSNSSDCQSTSSLRQHQSRNLSILYMFSKFKSCGQAKSSSQEEDTIIQNEASSIRISPSSSELQSSRTT